MCVLIIFLFSSYQVRRKSSLVMGNGVCVGVHGVGTVDPNITSRKTIKLKKVQHVPLIRNNLITGPLLCLNGYKMVFKPNKCISKYEMFRVEVCSVVFIRCLF